MDDSVDVNVSPKAILQGGVPQDIHREDAGQVYSSLSPEHREYLQARHGMIDLDPVPDPTEADPLNWPKWKVKISLSKTTYANVLENRQSHPRCISRLHGNIHRSEHHPSL